MSVSVQSAIDIAATVSEVLEVIGDVESLTEWSSAHRAVEIRETDDNGWPLLVWSKISQFGLADEMLTAYQWQEDGVAWHLAEPSSTQKAQNARYTLTDNGDGTCHAVFDLEVELRVKLPSMIVKKAQKSVANTATEGLKTEVERRRG